MEMAVGWRVGTATVSASAARVAASSMSPWRWAWMALSERDRAWQALGGGMAEVGKDHLLKPQGLLRHGSGDAGLAMAVQGDPPAADGIDQLTAVVEFEHGAAAGHRPQGGIGPGHLGGGVPEMGMPAQGLACG